MEIESLLDDWDEFLKAFDQANKVSQIPLPNSKFEIGYTKAKYELFSLCYKDIYEHLNRQIGLSLRFENDKKCVFSVKKFEHYSGQLILIEVVNLGDLEIKHLYKNQLFVANKCDIFESNYNIRRQYKRKQFPANNNHPHQIKLKWFQVRNKRVVSYWLMIWATYSFFKPFYSFSTFCQPIKCNQLTVALQKLMIFSVANDGIQCTLDFGPDSVTIAVNDLVQKITISSQEIRLAIAVVSMARFLG